MGDPKNPSALLSILLDSNFHVVMEVSPWISGALILLLVVTLAIKYYRPIFRAKDFEVDEAEFGIGEQKIKLKPNLIDKQIAYKVWVELSTRKIGIPIDLNNDVIYEIYESWYSFFAVTRDLIKDVPVSKFQRKDTEKIIRLSIDVLNLGLRPHLTKWQARYRRWHDIQLTLPENQGLEPQELQKKYMSFEELEKDLLSVNKRLIGYRNKMYAIISGVA